MIFHFSGIIAGEGYSLRIHHSFEVEDAGEFLIDQFGLVSTHGLFTISFCFIEKMLLLKIILKLIDLASDKLCSI